MKEPQEAKEGGRGDTGGRGDPAPTSAPVGAGSPRPPLPRPSSSGPAPTVAAALASAVPALAAAGVDTPRLDAQLLLAWTLKARREDLARDPDRPLTDRERVIFEKAVALRTLRRPLPYITGEAWFYGRPFKINRAVLIPRPETEDLAQAALELCRDESAPTLADIGVGSGCLAVTLALEHPGARLWATDLSADALKLARKNVARYDLGERVTLLQGDLLGPLPTDLRFDVIVSNPPYVLESDLPGLQPEVRDYEPVLALSGEPGAAGADGTALHRRLLAEAPARLTPGGRLLMEVGQGQAEAVAQAARDFGYEDVMIRKDMAGIGRIILGRLPLALTAVLAIFAAGCSARDPVTQTPVYHIGTPTNRSSVNSWELDTAPLNTQPGVYGGKPVRLKAIASQRRFEVDDPAAKAVLSALSADGQVPTQYLSASGNGGVVILIGSVPDAAHKARAEQIARAVPGVKRLDSRVMVVP